VDVDDLMQVGLVGLLRARESYDAGQGASFMTYAGIRIKGAMLDEVRANDWLPRSVQSKLYHTAAAIQKLEARLGRPPVDAEVAGELGLQLEDYQRLAGELACARMTPLDDPDVEAPPAGEVDEPFENVGRQRFPGGACRGGRRSSGEGIVDDVAVLLRRG
jgi:RNA polymerase sigma factor for flagellar operon FliA